MPVKCIIVDDEHLARKLLENYVNKIPQLELVAKCKNPLEAIDVLSKEDIELIFLDIQMPELTGIEFLKTLQKKPAVIFTTAYSDYALEGYQLDVIDYLLKPFSFERLLKAVNKALEQIQLKQSASTQNESPAEIIKSESKDYIVIKGDHKLHKINHDEIIKIEGLKEYVTFYTEQQKFITLESLKNLEQTLPAGKFIRIHKSYIVSVKHIKNLEGNILQVGKEKLPVGKNYREHLVKTVFQK